MARRRHPRRRAPAGFVVRWLRRTIASLVLLVLLLVGGIAGLAWLSAPDRDATVHIPGLHAPVGILLDADGVPRVRATDSHDAAAALGWLHARDRFFQMEMMRRLVSGRLAEIVGPAALPSDRLMRTLGLRRAAEADWAGMPEPTRGLLEAYAAGVNARLAQRGRLIAPEILALGAFARAPSPAPWSPVDSLLWGKLMALSLSGNWRAEAARLAARDLPGMSPRGVLAWWPVAPGRPASAALRQGFAAPDLSATARALLAAIPAFPAPNTLPDEASDAWAVDGAHSATGAPLLAGDPHLGFSLPGVWYLARIDTPDQTLAGATAPGLPFLVLGRNRAIAWSFTTTGADTEDLFIETLTTDGKYQTPGGPAAFSTRTETISVRGAPSEQLRIRTTRHGPVISDLIAAPPAGTVIALAAAMLDGPDHSAAGLAALNTAGSVAEARALAPMIAAPVQNLLVADRAHIGLFTTGRIPRRPPGDDGAYPVAGADGSHDWTGYARGNDLPGFIDPPSGRLLNANEPVAPDFPLLIGRDAYGPWRAARIRELLDAGPADSASFAAMQADDVSLWARALLPALGALPPPSNPRDAAARALLTGWDGRMAVNLPQPLIFESWMQRFYLDLLPAGLDQAAAPWLEVVAHALGPQGADLCGADCPARLARALAASDDALAARFGADPAQWRWGAAHQALFAHPVLGPLLGRLPLLGSWFAATVALPGSDSTLLRGGGRPGDLLARHGASFRGVYDLADLDRSRFIVAPGQSGDPFSAAATGLLARWRDGATVTLAREPGRIARKLRCDP